MINRKVPIPQLVTIVTWHHNINFVLVFELGNCNMGSNCRWLRMSIPQSLSTDEIILLKPFYQENRYSSEF